MIKPDIFNLTENTIYRVDRNFRVLAFNQAYVNFAEANGAKHFTTDWGVGTSVVACCPAPMRPAIAKLYERAFAGESVELEYLCHSPEKHRRYQMRLVGESGGTVLAEHSLIFEEPHREILDLEHHFIAQNYTQETGLIVRCCHCQKIRKPQPDRWDLVRAYIGRALENLSHGLCPVCAEHLYPGLNEG